MKLLIKGTLTALGDGEFQEDLIYHFKVSPMAQDKNGDDRVFTFILYTKKQSRNSPKNSKERKLIARNLRARHSILWRNFHNAMDRE